MTKYIILFLCFSSALQAQTDGALTLRNSFWGYGYKLNDKNISFGEVETILKQNNQVEAISYLHKGKTQQVFSNVLGIPGGFIIGWELGLLISGKETNTTMWVSGGALTVASYIIGAASKKNFSKVIALNNGGMAMGIGLTPSGGLGLCLKL